MYFLRARPRTSCSGASSKYEPAAKMTQTSKRGQIGKGRCSVGCFVRYPHRVLWEHEERRTPQHEMDKEGFQKEDA